MWTPLIILVEFIIFCYGLADWELGPFIKQDSVNPILGPLNTTPFFCPIRRVSVLWEEKDVFNPTAIVINGKIHLIYRAEDTVGAFQGTSRIGLAVSTDGLNFERMPLPIFYPDEDSEQIYEWEGGCEDPRIIQDANGTYFMTYTAYDGSYARLFIASSPDLLRWTKHGSIFSANPEFMNISTKSASIVTKQDGDSFIATKLNDKYWLFFGDTNIYAATSEDLINWTPFFDQVNGDQDKLNLTIVFGPRKGYFDSRLVEPGPQSILREEDNTILLIYNGMNLKNESGNSDPSIPDDTYSAGQILLNATNPFQVLNRSEEYFITPEKPYEIVGQVGNVVFLEGLVSYKGSWYLYYGTADSYIAVAKTE